MKKKPAQGHAKKHTGTKKHQQQHHGAKHHPAHQHAHHKPAVMPGLVVHAKAKHPHHAKARGLSLSDVQCCAAEALAWSLRLAGWPVAPADVLDLYKLTADSPDAGASILATLDAAYVFGLAGVRPLGFERVFDLEEVMPHDLVPQCCCCTQPGPHASRAGLILGVDLPGPHTVLQQDGQWWTWGEPYDPRCFPDAVIEEAWAVTWP